MYESSHFESSPWSETLTSPHWEKAAQAMDAGDELASFRSQFYLPEGIVYMDGNSLGLLSRQAEETLLQVLQMWKTTAIDGWTQGALPWFFMAEDLAMRTAPLIGAQPEEVIVTNSTTVNLHQLLATLYDLKSARPCILTDAASFPSDLYALQSQLKLRGLDPGRTLMVAPVRNGLLLEEEDIVARMTADIQIVLLPSVVYTSGQLLNIGYLTAQAHQRGILIGFDCSHSIGALPHDFDAQDVDFAFWCSYKYLNAGPGATGGLYLNRRHFGRTPGLAGWFSSAKERQFDMAPVLEARADAGALQIGTPNILSMAPLYGALELMQQAGIERLRRKSLAATEFLMEMAEAELTELGVEIGTPREPLRRGGHVALLHPEAMRVCKALRRSRVVPDYRPPNIIRLAPVALYNSFQDCCQAVSAVKSILTERSYEKVTLEREIVS